MKRCILIFLLLCCTHLQAAQVAVQETRAQEQLLPLLKQPVTAFKDDTAPAQIQRALAQRYAQLQTLLHTSTQNINIQDEKGYTPLMHALQGIAIEEYGANQEDIDSYRMPTPLPWITLLLQQNPLVNLQGTDGKSALHLAVENLNADAVRLLLEKGADISLLDAEGKTALASAEPQEYDSPENRLTRQAIKQLIEKQAGEIQKITEATLTHLPIALTDIISELATASPSKKRKLEPEAVTSTKKK